MARLPVPPTPLADARAGLRVAAERDIPEVLIAHQDDPGLAAALGRRRPPTGAQLGRRVEAAEDARRLGESLWLTVTVAGSDECAGQLETVDLDLDHHRTGLLVWIAPHLRGRGLGGSALALAGGLLLGDGGFARVWLLAPPGDGALRGAALRAGFRSEGVLRGYGLGPRGRTDAEVLSLIAADRAPAG